MRLEQSVYAAIVEHAYRDHPVEACGVVVESGAASGQRAVAMANAEGSRWFFRLDPQEQLRVWHEIEAAGERLVAVYHSHTATPAVPSGTDLAYAAEPGVYQLIVSTHTRQLRAWLVRDGQPTEENIEVC